ncbi:MAG TPA: hypothetical protein VMP89_16350 [Solirubrobacteraceae bacterium]|jgi:hypothetical protein|nr:hypothetical protein [Solirubrobacteraceae bacterium]
METPYPADWYAPATSDVVKRTAAMAVARRLGHEGVQVHEVAEDRTDRVIVYEVTAERWPSGVPKLGRAFMVTVRDDGRTIVRAH